MGNRRLALVALVIILAAACRSTGQSQPTPAGTDVPGVVVGVLNVSGGPQIMGSDGSLDQSRLELMIRPYGADRANSGDRVPTDAAGNFTLEEPPGTYLLNIRGTDVEQQVDIESGRTVRVDLEMPMG